MNQERHDNGLPRTALRAAADAERFSAMDEYGHPTHEEYVAQQRSFAASVAQGVLDGKMTALEGARVISRLDGLDLGAEDEDLCCLQLVDDETETLPIGDVRTLWSPAALLAKAAELERAELWAR